MKNIWQALEGVPGSAAVAAEWQSWAGADFATAKGAFLQAAGRQARSYPCPQECGCRHRVVDHGDGRIVAVCQCEPWNCDDFRLSEADLVVYELSWARLGRAIAKAFGCDPKDDSTGLPGTRQVAAFGGNALPVFLTIQLEGADFRSVVGQLAARQRGGFILLAPTNRFLDATARELLGNATAGFFDLASNVTLMPSGVLGPRKPGGELFAPFLPAEGASASEAEAVRVFALMKRLDSGPRKRKAPLERVFRLMVLERRSQDFVAHECKCVPSLISMRVDEIERKMGRKIEELQGLASRLGEMDTAEKDPRARRLYRRGLTDDTGDDEEEN